MTTRQPPPPLFTPARWYWIVGGSTTQVYSSAAGDYVPVSNAGYVAWLAAGNTPTKIDTEASLSDVLATYSLRPVTASVLDAYTGSQASGVDAVVGKILFNHENRIRALESKVPLTAAQFVAAIKTIL